MSETDGEKIGRLVGYLRGSDLVEWEQVDECVAGFPGWVRMMQMLRNPIANPNTRVISMGSPLQYSVVTADKRASLLEIFEPYALLLDPTRTPSERALALSQAGYDVMAFCKENRANGSRAIADAAKTTLEACRAEKDLLRGSARPNVSAESLRAAPTGAERDDSLLHPSESPPEIASKPGLFARIKQKMSGGRRKEGEGMRDE